MFYYHENQTDEIHLDKEPLLQLTPTTNTTNDENYCISNDISICIDEYYLNKLEIMSRENECEKDTYPKYSNTLNDNSFTQDLQSRQDQADISANLCGIFVVSFDTKRGNVIEWQIPERLDLERIEFKAMASGFHLIQNDVVYFCQKDMFGLAAFQSIRIENTEERNIRMKSVGMLAKSYKFLRKYVTFLKNQVKHLLDDPGNYESLISLWTEKKVLDRADFDVFDNPSLPKALDLNETSFIDKLFSKRINIFKVNQKQINGNHDKVKWNIKV